MLLFRIGELLFLHGHEADKLLIAAFDDHRHVGGTASVYLIRLERHIPAGERPARGGENELDAEQGGEDNAGFP